MARTGFPPGLRPRGLMRGDGSRIRHVAWSPQGKRIAAGCSSGHVLVWNGGDPEPLQVLEGHASAVDHVSWSPDQETLASACGDNVVHLWNSGTGALLRRLELPACPRSLTWSPEGTLLRSAQLIGTYPEVTVRLESHDPGATASIRSEEIGPVSSLAISGDRSLLAAGTREGSLHVWDLARLSRITTLPGDGREVCGVALSPGRQTLALSFDDGTVQVRRLGEERPPVELSAGAQPASSVAFSPDGRTLAAKSGDSVRIWCRKSWVDPVEMPASAQEVELAFHPLSTRLATLDESGCAIRVWDIDGERLCLYGGQTMISILFLAADPSGSSADRLHLDRELREIQEKLRLANLRELFKLEVKMAVRPSDLSQALLDFSPEFVHFSGHGTESGNLLIEDEAGRIQPIDPETLAETFELVSEHVKCVILNACHSEAQAQAIARSIDYVIGMNKAIGDDAAIWFSVGFYQALGAGRSIEKAYRFGCNQIRLQGIPENLTPVLIRKPAAEAGTA